MARRGSFVCASALALLGCADDETENRDAATMADGSTEAEALDASKAEPADARTPDAATDASARPAHLDSGTRDGGRSSAELDASMPNRTLRDSAAPLDATVPRDASHPWLDATAAKPTAPDASATDAGVAVDAATSVAGKRAFLTSIRYTAALGGPDGADAICMAHAEAESLDGEFRAWLSTLDSAVASRLTHSTEPYRTLAGTLIAADWDDLVDGALAAPLNVDETGRMVAGDVWTGTLRDGEPYATSDCGGFTSADIADRALCGNASSATYAWTENITPACSTPLRLYCLEQ